MQMQEKSPRPTAPELLNLTNRLQNGIIYNTLYRLLYTDFYSVAQKRYLMYKRIVSFLLSLVMLLACLSAFAPAASAATYASELRDAGFPESYITALTALHNKYPKWVFKPLKTGLSWSTAVAGERSSHANQALERGYGSEYYCTCSKCSGYSGYPRPASQWAVEHYMDPRNWLDEKHIFQFESTEYNSAHTQSGVEAILSWTFMKNAGITYLDGHGKTLTYSDGHGKAMKYSAAIMEAAKKSGLSAYYIAGRIVKEVGSSGKPTASGTVGNRAPFNGIYNYFSIGASSSGTQGLEWASGFLKTNQRTTFYNSGAAVDAGQRLVYISESTNYYYVRLYNKSGSSYTGGTVDWVPKSACNTVYFTYERPWTNPYKAIVGGAEYIAASYAKQYTPYLQKFNVNPNGSLYSHEYMVNIDAVSKESESTYKAYSDAGQLANAKTFYIPVFKDMPNDTGVYGEWKQVGSNWYYYLGGEKVTGWLEISGKWYYFNGSGVMQTGWQKLSGKWYYFNTGGTMRTGWLKDDGKWYYLGSDGVMVTYRRKIDGKWYYFSGSGAMYTGWLAFSGDKWYFTPDGPAATGFAEIDGNWYYFSDACVMQTGWVKDDGKWYYLGTDGVMVKYRQTIDGDSYYFTGAGVMKTGWLKIGDSWYYYQSSGKMKKNGWETVDGQSYYFDKNGMMQTGWLELSDGKYYLNASGAMVKYRQTIDGKSYYFNGYGRLYHGFLTVSGKRYYYGEDGAMVKYRQNINGKLYYFNGNGEMVTGWLTIGNDWYYFGTDGAAATGMQTIGGKQYCFNENGVMLKYRQEIDGKLYYFSGSGVMYKGWLTIGENKYYFGADGAAVTGEQTIGGKTYTFDQNGVLQE